MKQCQTSWKAIKDIKNLLLLVIYSMIILFLTEMSNENLPFKICCNLFDNDLKWGRK